MTLIEKYDDWCKEELQVVSRWLNTKWVKTSKDVFTAQESALERIFGIALFIQTLDNAPSSTEVDYRLSYWSDRIKNICKLRLTTL